jgi:hypothetical protein
MQELPRELFIAFPVVNKIKGVRNKIICKHGLEFLFFGFGFVPFLGYYFKLRMRTRKILFREKKYWRCGTPFRIFIIGSSFRCGYYPWEEMR